MFFTYYFYLFTFYMPSIFNKEDCRLLINRINAITPDTKPLWGKMNATQVMGHCKVTFDSATGKTFINRGIISFIFGGIAKKQIFSDKPFKKNLPTAKEFIISVGKDFEEEKVKLITAINDLCSRGTSAINAAPHPFFGPLTIEEWDGLIVKHTDHHLKQFGV